MTENYYVRFFKDGQWNNALRNGVKHVSLEVAENLMSKCAEKGYAACLFEDTGDGKAKLIRRTQTGEEM